MITKPTLFILGAGASIPYGFPSGLQLRQQICNLAANPDAPVAARMSKYFNIHQDELQAFTYSFMQSRLASIDAFLSRRGEFSNIGKLVIASLLTPNERVQKFNESIDDDWYFSLWNALVSNVSNVDELQNNQIRIFTFNYDRSLESYLHSAIINTFAVDSDKALEILRSLNIHHVYGSLGYFGYQDDYSKSVRAYNEFFNKESIEVAASTIKVIPEARAEDMIFAKAKDAFWWASNICFLGFGFDSLNVERLGFNTLSLGASGEVSQAYINKRVITSSFGKTDSQMEMAHSSLFDTAYHRGIPEWNYRNYSTNIDTLSNFAWLLS